MRICWKSASSATLLVLIALPAMANGPTGKSAPSVPMDARTAWYHQSAATLSRLPDANSLVAAAVVQLDGYPEAKMSLLDRAAKADPAGTDIAAMAQLTCAGITDCNAIARADRLHALDPDNALAWMPRLRAASRQGDDAQVTRLLQRMARSPRFHTYAVDIAKRVDDGLKSVPLNPDPQLQTRLGEDDSRTVLAGFLTTTTSAIPAFQSIVRPCMPGAPQYQQRRKACRQIGLLLQASDGFMARHVGLALHRRAAAGPADYARALADGRRMDWQYRSYMRFVGGAKPDGMASFLRSELRLHSQSAAIQALLTQHGISLDPPANWVDKAQADRIAADKRALMAAQSSPRQG